MALVPQADVVYEEYVAPSGYDVVDAAVVFTDLHAVYNGKSDAGATGYKQEKITQMMNALKGAKLPISSVWFP